MTSKSPRIGVVLSGCGFLDGSEVHESVLTLLHLDRCGASVECFAPRRPQMHVVDHSTGQPVESESRDVFVESARIARGKIRDLAEASAEELDGLIMPGGFGAAKNLSTFATAGADAEVEPALVELLRALHRAGKPIGAICISPAVLTAAFRGAEVGPRVTIGDDAGTANAIETMGGKHESCSVTEFLVDENNRIASCPAYMFDAKISDVSVGIERVVRQVVAWAGGAR